MKQILYATFETESGGQYVFDGPTGAVFPVNAVLAEAIELFATQSLDEVRAILRTRYRNEEVDGALDFVERWAEHFLGFYRREEVCRTTGSDSKVPASVSNRKVAQARPGQPRQLALKDRRSGAGMPAQLILHVTEECSVRCKYCIFSEAYELTRNRSSVRMPPEVAIKAVNYFCDLLEPISRKNPGKTASVSFYGGEPLLEIGLIRQVIEHARAHAPTPISFGVVSSFTVLTEETIDFLVAENVKVCVSLDGNKEDHDRNRPLPNGRGTFDLVYRNIKRFQKRHPSYTNLYILSAYDCKTDLERNIEFFEEEDLPPILFVSPVRGENTNYWENFSAEDKDRFQEALNRTAARYVALKKQGKEVPEYLAALYDGFVAEVLLRNRPGDSSSIFPQYTSQCIPGMKIQVRPNGVLDMCERVNASLPIGDLAAGLDETAIDKIMHSYNSSITNAADCAGCVFNRNCSLCFATCCKDGTFARQDNWCASFRSKYIGNLSGTYSILEENPSAFDVFYTWPETMDRNMSLLYRCNRSQVAPLGLVHTIEPR